MLKKDGLFIWGYFAWLDVQIILDTMYFQSQLKHKITSKKSQARHQYTMVMFLKERKKSNN